MLGRTYEGFFHIFNLFVRGWTGGGGGTGQEGAESGVEGAESGVGGGGAGSGDRGGGWPGKIGAGIFFFIENSKKLTVLGL